MGLTELLVGLLGLGILISFAWFVEQYKKNEYQDLDFYDDEES